MHHKVVQSAVHRLDQTTSVGTAEYWTDSWAMHVMLFVDYRGSIDFAEENVRYVEGMGGKDCNMASELSMVK